MKHELLRLYGRIAIFFLRQLNLYDDLDYWAEIFNERSELGWEDPKVEKARDDWIAEKVSLIYNSIFNQGLFADQATWEEALESIKSLDKSS